MRRKQKACLLIGLVLLVLTACSYTKFISEEPTDYTLTVTEGYGKLKTLYLTAEHPDVQLVIPLVEEFLAIDQTQDYNNPTWEKLAPLAQENLITERQGRETDTLIEHTIIKRLHDCQVKRIVFMDRQVDRATVTAELNVAYTSVGERYAGWYNIKLDELTPMEATLDLKKMEGKWFVRSSRYSYLNP